MIDLVEVPWSKLETLCREHRVQQLDILTGFIGTGAGNALARLGVRAFSRLARLFDENPHAVKEVDDASFLDD
jgi:hypothetical protein